MTKQLMSAVLFFNILASPVFAGKSNSFRPRRSVQQANALREHSGCSFTAALRRAASRRE